MKITALLHPKFIHHQVVNLRLHKLINKRFPSVCHNFVSDGQLIYLLAAKVERPMALNLVNDDDGGSHGDVAQIKESAESYPGKVCSV